MESQEHHHSLEEVGELKDLRMPLQIHWCLLLHLQRQYPRYQLLLRCYHRLRHDDAAVADDVGSGRGMQALARGKVKAPVKGTWPGKGRGKKGSGRGKKGKVEERLSYERDRGSLVVVRALLVLLNFVGDLCLKRPLVRKKSSGRQDATMTVTAFVVQGLRAACSRVVVDRACFSSKRWAVKRPSKKQQQGRA